MRKTLLLTSALLAIGCSAASAQGINLSWNDCGTFGANAQTFDCAANTGTPFTLIGSFIPPAGIDQFLGVSAQVDFTSSTATLPDWWKHGTGQCRGTGALSVSVDFTSQGTSCADFYQGQAVSGFIYDIGYGTPNRGRLVLQSAVPFDNRGPVDSNTEYSAFRVSINLSKSTLPAVCAGCSTPMCIVLNSIQLYQPPESNNDPILSNPAASNFAYWQAPVTGCPQSTASRSSTWGQVKSLYR